MLRFMIGVLVVVTMQIAVQGQSVIVNEMSQGSDGGKEWVELLVVSDGVDMREWELGDFDDGTWHSIAEFTTHSDWSSLDAGTIIVIYNSGDVDANITSAGGEDTDFTDKSVLIPINNTTYVTDTGPWGSTAGAFSNADGDDCAALRNSSDVIIHDMAVTHGTATVTSPGSGEVKYYTGNTTSGTSNNSNWTEASSTSGTPGTGNGGDNSNWVDSSLPVELSTWAATSSRGHVLLSWTTESEIENQGFIISRIQNSEGSKEEQWQQISSFVTHDELVGHGSTSIRNTYEYVDKNVEIGRTYTYQLSDVDYRGVSFDHPQIQITVSQMDLNPKPAEMQLHSAYPNPFNPEISITYTLDKPADPFSLRIFDLKGALINSLHSGAIPAGIHTRIWNGRDTNDKAVPAGLYLVQLSTSEMLLTQGITLLR